MDITNMEDQDQMFKDFTAKFIKLKVATNRVLGQNLWM